MKNSGIKVEFAKCSKCDCGEERFIVNRTHFLCEEKNRERLDKNKDPDEKAKKINYLISKKGLKPVSKKKAAANRKKAAAYREVDNNSTGICSGCRSSSHLSHSHLVPIGFNASLEDNVENIVEHCVMSSNGGIGCHDIWEHGSAEDLRNMYDFEENMERVKRLDPKYYRKMINRLNK